MKGRSESSLTRRLFHLGQVAARSRAFTKPIVGVSVIPEISRGKPLEIASIGDGSILEHLARTDLNELLKQQPASALLSIGERGET